MILFSHINLLHTGSSSFKSVRSDKETHEIVQNYKTKRKAALPTPGDCAKGKYVTPFVEISSNRVRSKDVGVSDFLVCEVDIVSAENEDDLSMSRQQSIAVEDVIWGKDDNTSVRTESTRCPSVSVYSGNPSMRKLSTDTGR